MISPCRAKDGGMRPYEDMDTSLCPLEPNEVKEKVEPAPKRAKSGLKTKPLERRVRPMWTNDEIHGRISMCPVFKAFMDSPQVQRLHGLKQLATASLVYMNANHTRFDHSMGVAYLAEKLCSHLQSNYPNLNITDKDVLCVKLAGLFHDLGHGPFSHVYEEVVTTDWSHESAALMMIDALLEGMGLAINMNKLDEPLEQVGDGIEAESIRVYKRGEKAHEHDPESILTSRDLVFIKECIIGKPLAGFSDFIGRPQKKEFLYDIVSNRHSGLDVDKMDYLSRDSNRTTGKVDIDIRLIDEAFVAWGLCPKPKECHMCSEDCPRSHLMICYPPKLRRDAMEFFKKRFKSHSEVYQHKTVVAGAFMVKDILAKADPYFQIPTLMEKEQGVKSVKVKELPISRAMENPTSYLRLKDSVLDQIMATTSPALREARLLIERYQKRDLYSMAFKKQIKLSQPTDASLWRMSKEDIANEVLRIGGEHADESGRVVQLDREDFIVEKLTMHHGGRDANPVDFMRFMEKEEDEEELLGPIDKLPHAVAMTSGLDGSKSVDMQELWLRFYCRGDDDKLDLLRHILKLWDLECESEAMITEENTSDSDDDDRVILMTQEEEESSFGGTPQKGGGRGYDSDGEPSPFPAPRPMH